jgi:hypothetical protein
MFKRRAELALRTVVDLVLHDLSDIVLLMRLECQEMACNPRCKSLPRLLDSVVLVCHEMSSFKIKTEGSRYQFTQHCHHHHLIEIFKTILGISSL